MATQKPISTISYNTEAFLRERLNAWLKAHIIQCYQYIFHKGEDGAKDHIHLRIEPNKKLDPMDLQDMLNEYPIGSEKPLGVRPFRPSKEEDWYLYAVHDEDYLKIKYGGESKGEKIPYSWKDIKVPDNYDLEDAFIRAKATLKHTSANIASRLMNGDKAVKLVMEGENVFTVNALLRAVSNNDYQALQDKCFDLEARYNNLEKLIESAGFDIEFNEKRIPVKLKKR